MKLEVLIHWKLCNVELVRSCLLSPASFGAMMHDHEQCLCNSTRHPYNRNIFRLGHVVYIVFQLPEKTH